MDDWHKVADDRSAEIVRLTLELEALQERAERWRAARKAAMANVNGETFAALANAEAALYDGR